MAPRARPSVGQVPARMDSGGWSPLRPPSDPGLCGAAAIIPAVQKETVFSDVTLQISRCVRAHTHARARQMDGWSESVFVRGGGG